MGYVGGAHLSRLTTAATLRAAQTFPVTAFDAECSSWGVARFQRENGLLDPPTREVRPLQSVGWPCCLLVTDPILAAPYDAGSARFVDELEKRGYR